jgi:hypothetical protein
VGAAGKKQEDDDGQCDAAPRIHQETASLAVAQSLVDGMRVPKTKLKTNRAAGMVAENWIDGGGRARRSRYDPDIGARGQKLATATTCAYTDGASGQVELWRTDQEAAGRESATADKTGWQGVEWAGLGGPSLTPGVPDRRRGRPPLGRVLQSIQKTQRLAPFDAAMIPTN